MVVIVNQGEEFVEYCVLDVGACVLSVGVELCIAVVVAGGLGAGFA